MGDSARRVNAFLFCGFLLALTSPCLAEQPLAPELHETALDTARVTLRDQWDWTEAASAPLDAPNLWRDVLVIQWSLPTGLFMQASIAEGVRFGFGPPLAPGLAGRRFGVRYRWDRFAILTRF